MREVRRVRERFRECEGGVIEDGASYMFPSLQLL